MKKTLLTLCIASFALFANAQADRYAKMSDTIPTAKLLTKAQADAKYSPLLNYINGVKKVGLDVSADTTLVGSKTWINGRFGSFVPYSGATSDVNLGAKSITARTFTSSYNASFNAEYRPFGIGLENGAGNYKNLMYPFKDGMFALTTDIRDSLTNVVRINPTIPQIGNIDLSGGLTTRNSGNAVTYNTYGMTNLLGFNVSVDAQGVNLNGNDIKFKSAGVLLGRVGNGSDGPKTEFAHMRVTQTPANPLDVVRLGDLSNFTATVNTIADLQAYSGLATTVIVKDALRGGPFNYDNTGVLTIDNGRNFPAPGKGGGAWGRLTADIVGTPVRWYGAKGDWNLATNTGTDNRAALILAMNSQANKNTALMFDYGVYGVSDSLMVGEGTYIKGLTTLLPKQYNNTGTDSVIYKNMTAVKFYNNTNGFVGESGSVNYRGQGVKIEGIGVFGAGKDKNKTGFKWNRNNNSSSFTKGMGLGSMIYVYFSDWGVAADGTNSTDSWYIQYCHFSDVKMGVIGSTIGQTYIDHSDFFRIDSIGASLNYTVNGDIVTNSEFEPRYSKIASLVLGGSGAIVSNNLFFQGTNDIKVLGSANSALISNNQFTRSINDNIVIDSGAVDIKIQNNGFNLRAISLPDYNYNFQPITFNYNQNFVKARYVTGLRITDNTMNKTWGSYTGSGVTIDNCPAYMANGNKMGGLFSSTTPDERLWSITNSTRNNMSETFSDIYLSSNGPRGLNMLASQDDATSSARIFFGGTTGYGIYNASGKLRFTNGAIGGTTSGNALVEISSSGLDLKSIKLGYNGSYGSASQSLRNNSANTGLEFYDPLFISSSSTVPTPTSAGSKGEVRYISGFKYECIATNTWVRIAITTTW